MYRLLEDGEIIQSGDEVYSSLKGGDWVEAPTSVGEIFSLEITYPYRRKINTKEEKLKSPNKAMLQLLCDIKKCFESCAVDVDEEDALVERINAVIAQQQHS